MPDIDTPQPYIYEVPTVTDLSYIPLPLCPPVLVYISIHFSKNNTWFGKWMSMLMIIWIP